MAPKQPAETFLSDERRQELKDMLEGRGYDVFGIDVRSLEWCDKALRAGWKIPTTSAAEAMRNAEPASKQRKNLRVYAVHSAREHLGEPVGGKHEA
jgi:hypothetical protein